MVSKFRPEAPIIAATSSEKVMRKLAMVWGTYPVFGNQGQNTDEVVNEAIEATKNAGYADSGDIVVITAGVPVGQTGKTNLIRVSTISEFLGRGVGIGTGTDTIEGKARLVMPGQDADFKEGEILVAVGTDRDMMKYIEKASAIVAETGGMTSHAAIVGINLGIPVVVSVNSITEKIKDGDDLRIEITSGSVYKI